MDIQTLRAAALTSEELLRRLTAEMIALDTSGAGMRLDIGCPTAFAVVACVQLALRHPHANLGPSAALVRDFIEMIRAKFEPHAPAIALAIERGNDPQHDTPREESPLAIPPEAFGGMRPPAPELRFWRLINERSIGEDGIQDLQLACGHHIAFVQPLQESQEYAYCPQCGLSYLVTLYEPPQEAEPSTLFEFLATRKEPATPEDIQAYLDRRRGDAPPPILTCPYCGHSHIAPSPLAKVDVYICPKCGRTVETA